MSKIDEKINEFFNSDKRCLFIIGKQGSGKTTLINTKVISRFDPSEIGCPSMSELGVNSFGLSSLIDKKVAIISDIDYSDFKKCLLRSLPVILGQEVSVNRMYKTPIPWDFSKTKFVFGMTLSQFQRQKIAFTINAISTFINLDKKDD